MNQSNPVAPESESQNPAPSSPPGSRIISDILRYSLAVVLVAAGLILRLGLEALAGKGLPTFITFYPFLMVTALVGGFGPGMLSIFLTLFVVDIWVHPPVGHFALNSPAELVGFALFAFMGLFMSVVAELFRRSRVKAAAYDQEQALRETRKEREFLAYLLQNAEQPFAIGYLDGTLSRFNHAFEKLTGYTAEELRVINWSTQLTAPEWRDQEQRKLDELTATGKPVRYEKEYIRKDGSRIPIELLVHIGREEGSGRAYYYSFISVLTERRKAEAAIQEANAKLQQHATELQTTINELSESQMAALNLAEDAETARRQAEESSHKAQAANNALRESRLAALNLAEDADISRKVTEATSRELLKEISERKRTEEQLRRRTEELDSANRQLDSANKELEAFSYSVAHDLRNPLHTIVSFAEFVIEDYSDRLDEQGKDYLDKIKSGVMRMRSIIDDMLALSKISRQDIELSKVDLSDMARKSIGELQKAQPERHVDVTVQEGLLAKADARLLSVAMGNLLGNAWKYTGKTEHARIEFGMHQEDGRRVYFVKDNGAGFDMQQADKLFTPFRRLHAEREFAGTGVGLAIVERAIERHGGQVWAEGEKGKGATFYFTLLSSSAGNSSNATGKG